VSERAREREKELLAQTSCILCACFVCSTQLHSESAIATTTTHVSYYGTNCRLRICINIKMHKSNTSQALYDLSGKTNAKHLASGKMQFSDNCELIFRVMLHFSFFTAIRKWSFRSQCFNY
jgi:hypothetical protein